MTAWALVVIGLVVAGFGLFVGVVSYEVTLGLIVLGLAAAVVGAYLIIRGRRAA